MAVDWPERFRRAHGRSPRVLHVCNIANYAYVNAKLMRRFGIDCVVLDPDFYHVVSTPEWLEADISGDYGDDYFPRWRDVNLAGYRRPEWFFNGPSPFVLRELAAREAGQVAWRKLYALLSAIYRAALGARHGEVSAFRSFMESSDPASLAAKRMLRRLVVRGETRAEPQAEGLPAQEDLPEESLLPRGSGSRLLESAFGGFDVVVGYSLGSRFALGAGLKRFVSLELGTLRGVPFDPTPAGRMAARLYRQSPEVLVTNVDCIDHALQLGIPSERLTPIPHPFDLTTARDYALNPPPPPAEVRGLGPYFFCPARHHWQSGNASWLKGNDVLIKGAALAARRGHAFQLVMVEWGQELPLSRALIDECGLTSRVTWVRPMHRRRMWPLLASAVGVIDQFGVPAFGGVGLEAMAFGKPLISRIKGAQLESFFERPPPLLDADTPEAVAGRIAEVLGSSAVREAAGEAGVSWMSDQHGEARQLGLQFLVFDRLLKATGHPA